ncbi:putative atp-dependent rna helicase spindle-e [Cystoisospora suis]|uniref:Putative atp-dependent rna helicase spindle-e n=1 Tax=Cystoisospora suis TaxID=483139 RepID=A0A2C6L9X1_9APIC|nr:putative atp-dependent rna helicase spindle-e [Cystoisospora suis]
MLRRYLGQALRRLFSQRAGEADLRRKSDQEPKSSESPGNTSCSPVPSPSVPVHRGGGWLHDEGGRGAEKPNEEGGQGTTDSLRLESLSMDFDILVREIEMVASGGRSERGNTAALESSDAFPFDFVVVDEVHERSVDGDLSLLFLKFLLVLQLAPYALGKGLLADEGLVREQTRVTEERHPLSCSLASYAEGRERLIRFRVCVMSATVVTETFARYFSPSALADLLVEYRRWKGIDNREWETDCGVKRGDRHGSHKRLSGVEVDSKQDGESASRLAWSASGCTSDYSSGPCAPADSFPASAAHCSSPCLAGHLEVSSGLLYPVHEAYLEDILRLVMRTPPAEAGQGRQVQSPCKAEDLGGSPFGYGSLCVKSEDNGVVLTGGLLSFLGLPAERCKPLKAEKFEAGAECHSRSLVAVKPDKKNTQRGNSGGSDRHSTESRIRELTRSFFAEGAPPSLGGGGRGGSLSFAGQDGSMVDLYDVAARLITTVKERLSHARKPPTGRYKGRQSQLSVLGAPRGETERGDRVSGAVLVFLPGKAEIRRMHDALYPFRSSHGLYIVELHRDAPRRSFQEAMRTESSPGNVFQRGSAQRLAWRHGDGGGLSDTGNSGRSLTKVVLCTDVAESSLTVPEVFLVVDFCLRKACYVHPATSTKLLRLQWASRVSLIQRKGRTGRTREGLVCRLIPQRLWDLLPVADLPEIFRSPLEDVILDILAAFPFCSSDLPFILSQTLDSPRSKDISHAISVLHARGAVTCVENNNNPGCAFEISLTQLGRICCDLPLPSWLVKALIIARLLGVLDGVLRAAAIFASGRASLFLLADLPQGRKGNSSASRLSCDVFQFIKSRRSKMAASRGPLSFRRLLYSTFSRPSFHQSQRFPGPISSFSKSENTAEQESFPGNHEDVWGARIPCDVSAEIITFIELERAFGLSALQPGIPEGQACESAAEGPGCRRLKKTSPFSSSRQVNDVCEALGLRIEEVRDAAQMLHGLQRRLKRLGIEPEEMRSPEFTLVKNEIVVIPGLSQDYGLTSTRPPVCVAGSTLDRHPGSRDVAGVAQGSAEVVGPSVLSAPSSSVASSQCLSLRSWVWRVQLALAGGFAPFGCSFVEEVPGTEGLLGEAFTSCYVPARERETKLGRIVAMEEVESLLAACDVFSSEIPKVAQVPTDTAEPDGGHPDLHAEGRRTEREISGSTATQTGSSLLFGQPSRTVRADEFERAPTDVHLSEDCKSGNSTSSMVPSVRKTEEAKESSLAAAEALVNLFTCREGRLTFPASSFSLQEKWEATLLRVCSAFCPAVFACMPLLKSLDLSRLMAVSATFPLSGSPAGSASELRQIETLLTAFLVRRDEEEETERVQGFDCGDVLQDSRPLAATEKQPFPRKWVSSEAAEVRPNSSADSQTGGACEERGTPEYFRSSQQQGWEQRPFAKEPGVYGFAPGQGGISSCHDQQASADTWLAEREKQWRKGSVEGTSCGAGSDPVQRSTSAIHPSQSQWAGGLQDSHNASHCGSWSHPFAGSTNAKTHLSNAADAIIPCCWQQSRDIPNSGSLSLDHTVPPRPPQFGMACSQTWGRGDPGQQCSPCGGCYAPSQGGSSFSHSFSGPPDQRTFASQHLGHSSLDSALLTSALGELSNSSCYQQTNNASLWVSTTQSLDSFSLCGAGSVSSLQSTTWRACHPTSSSPQMFGVSSIAPFFSPAASLGFADQHQRPAHGRGGQGSSSSVKTSGWSQHGLSHTFTEPSHRPGSGGRHLRPTSGVSRNDEHRQAQPSSSVSLCVAAQSGHGTTDGRSGLTPPSPQAPASSHPQLRGEVITSGNDSVGNQMSSPSVQGSLVSSEAERLAGFRSPSPPYARLRDLSGLCQVERRDFVKERRKQQQWRRGGRCRRGPQSGESDGGVFPDGTVVPDHPDSFFAEECSQQWGKGEGASAARAAAAASGRGTCDRQFEEYMALQSRAMPSRAFLLRFASREKQEELVWMRKHRLNGLVCVAEGNEEQLSRFLEFSRLAQDEMRLAGSPPWSAALELVRPLFVTAGRRSEDAASGGAPAATSAGKGDVSAAKEEISLDGDRQPERYEYTRSGGITCTGEKASGSNQEEFVTTEDWMSGGLDAGWTDQALVGASSVLSGAAGCYPRQPSSDSDHFASSRRQLPLLRIAEWGGSASGTAESFRSGLAAADCERGGCRDEEGTGTSSASLASLGAGDWPCGSPPLKREIVAASLLPPVSHFQELFLLLFARTVIVCFISRTGASAGQCSGRRRNGEKQEWQEKDTSFRPTKEQGGVPQDKVASRNDEAWSWDSGGNAKAGRGPGSSWAANFPEGGTEKPFRGKHMKRADIQEDEVPASAFIVSVAGGGDFVLSPTHAWYREDIRCIRAVRQCLSGSAVLSMLTCSPSGHSLRKHTDNARLPSRETVKTWQRKVECFLGFLLLPRRRRSSSRRGKETTNDAGECRDLEDSGSLLDALAGPQREEKRRRCCALRRRNIPSNEELDEESATKLAPGKCGRKTFTQRANGGGVGWQALDWAKSARHEPRKAERGANRKDVGSVFCFDIESSLDEASALTLICEAEEDTPLPSCESALAVSELEAAPSSSPKVLAHRLWSSYTQLLRLNDPVEIALLTSCLAAPLPLSSSFPRSTGHCAPLLSPLRDLRHSPVASSPGGSARSEKGPADGVCPESSLVISSSPPLPAFLLADVDSLLVLPFRENLMLCGQPHCRFPLAVFRDLLLVFSPAWLPVTSPAHAGAVPLTAGEQGRNPALAPGKNKAQFQFRARTERSSGHFTEESSRAKASPTYNGSLDPAFFFGICRKYSGDFDVEVLRAISVFLSHKAKSNGVLFGPRGQLSPKEVATSTLGASLISSAGAPDCRVGHGLVDVLKAVTSAGLAEALLRGRDDVAAGRKPPVFGSDVKNVSFPAAPSGRPSMSSDPHHIWKGRSNNCSAASPCSPTKFTRGWNPTGSSESCQSRSHGCPTSYEAAPRARAQLMNDSPHGKGEVVQEEICGIGSRSRLDNSSCPLTPAPLIEVWVDPRDMRGSAQPTVSDRSSWGRSSISRSLRDKAVRDNNDRIPGDVSYSTKRDPPYFNPVSSSEDPARGRQSFSSQRAERMEFWPVRLLPLCSEHTGAQSTEGDRRSKTGFVSSSGSFCRSGTVIYEEKLDLLATVIDELRRTCVWRPSAFAFALSHFEALYEVKRALALGNDQLGWVACGHKQRPHLVGIHFYGRCVYIRCAPKTDEVTSNVAISSALAFLTGSYFLSPSPWDASANGSTSLCLVSLRDQSIPFCYSGEDASISAQDGAVPSSSFLTQLQGQPRCAFSSWGDERGEEDNLSGEQRRIFLHVVRLLCAKEAKIDREVVKAGQKALRLRTCQRVLFACLYREKVQHEAEASHRVSQFRMDFGKVFASCFSTRKRSASDLAREARRLEPLLLRVLALHRLQQRTGLQEYRMYTVHKSRDSSSQGEHAVSTVERQLDMEEKNFSGLRDGHGSFTPFMAGDKSSGKTEFKTPPPRYSSGNPSDREMPNLVPREVVREKTKSLLGRLMAIVTPDICASPPDNGTVATYLDVSTEQQTNCHVCGGNDPGGRSSGPGLKQKKSHGRAKPRQDDSHHFRSSSNENENQTSDEEEVRTEETLCMRCALALTNELVLGVVEQDRRGKVEENDQSPTWSSSSCDWNGVSRMFRWRHASSGGSLNRYPSPGLHSARDRQAVLQQTHGRSCSTLWGISKSDADPAVDPLEEQQLGQGDGGATETGGGDNLHPASPSQLRGELCAGWQDESGVAEVAPSFVTNCFSRKRPWPDGRAKVEQKCASGSELQSKKQQAIISSWSLPGEEETKSAKSKVESRHPEQAVAFEVSSRRECRGRWGGRAGVNMTASGVQQVIDVDVGEDGYWFNEPPP